MKIYLFYGCIVYLIIMIVAAVVMPFTRENGFFKIEKAEKEQLAKELENQIKKEQGYR